MSKARHNKQVSCDERERKIKIKKKFTHWDFSLGIEHGLEVVFAVVEAARGGVLQHQQQQDRRRE